MYFISPFLHLVPHIKTSTDRLFLSLQDSNQHHQVQISQEQKQQPCAVGNSTLGHMCGRECRTSVLQGIFGYLNYLVKRDRRFIADILVNGLHRLEYRGYDSSGIAFDGEYIEANDENSSSKSKRACVVVRQKGKVEELEHAVKG
jgi:hypothetical protein